MSREHGLLTPEERDDLADTALVRGQLEEQFENLDQQHQAGVMGMWVFLATEVMFFGTLFVALGIYHYLYPLEWEKASEKLNWVIGGINTIVLLVSSLTIVLAVHHVARGNRRQVMLFLGLTAVLGIAFLCFKGVEYYIDYKENLIPGWRFVNDDWIKDGLKPDQVPHVKLFLIFYWVMTATHGLHVTLGVIAVLVMLELTRRNVFTPSYYSPVDVTALYWHFVDIVWIFLLPMLYLLGTHRLGQ